VCSSSALSVSLTKIPIFGGPFLRILWLHSGFPMNSYLYAIYSVSTLSENTVPHIILQAYRDGQDEK